MPRNGKVTRANHSSEWENEDLFCTELEEESLNMGEFIHEIVALAEPLQPLGTDDCSSSCKNYEEAIKQGWLTPPRERETEQKSSPFAILNQLKQ